MTQRTLKAELGTLADVERPADLEIATLTRHDIPALALLHQDAYDEKDLFDDVEESTEEMRMAFDGVFGQPLDNSFIGAWYGGELVGAILAVLNPIWDDEPTPGPVVLDLMVAPAHRRRGIATALVGELARRLNEQGEASISLRLEPHHGEAAHLYGVMGFKEH